MCGISGVVLGKGIITEECLVASADRIKYRGPDGFGVKILHNGQVGLNHRRLSIIDLTDAGKQPMCNENQSVWITFNGEIYNYRSLREILVAKGHTFKSHSDTEVLIHGYEEWGTGLLDKIEGMFAFAIWDENRKHLFMARDRLGIKPLYYYCDGQALIFGSELKAFYAFPQFKRNMSYTALIDYLNLLVIPAPSTIWNNTFKVMPGHYLIYRPGEEVVQQAYWSLTPANKMVASEHAIGHVNELLTHAVQSHLESDVPVGLFLSSGYDSSALLAYMRDLNRDVNTFSIGFENSVKTEHREAAWVAEHFKTTHYECVLDEDFLDITDDLFNYYDEPYAISSMVSFYYISKLATKHNKVVFAGDGGDEVFGGYRWYNNVYKNFNARSWWSRMFRSSTNDLKTFYKHQYLKHMGMELDWVRSILSEDTKGYYRTDPLWAFNLPDEYWHLHPVKVFQLLDYKFFVPDVALPRSDRSSMAHSLEVRVPLLDHSLVEYTMQLDPQVYYRPEVKKYLLHENIKSKVPQRVLELPKRGFGNPLEYFDRNRQAVVSDLASSSLFKSSGFFNQLQLNQFSKKQLWLLFCLKCWYSKWA